MYLKTIGIIEFCLAYKIVFIESNKSKTIETIMEFFNLIKEK
jgi:hypothetical protein